MGWRRGKEKRANVGSVCKEIPFHYKFCTGELFFFFFFSPFPPSALFFPLQVCMQGWGQAISFFLAVLGWSLSALGPSWTSLVVEIFFSRL